MKKTGPTASAADILSYRHPDRRKNNPEVGMVTPATDPDEGKTVWQHDPHLDPTLSWTGKAERTSFAVDTVSLHVHERIDPASILSAARRKVGSGETARDKAKGAKTAQQRAMQPGLFDAPFESLPLRDAIDFYKHDKGWSNRLVAGDSLLVMNSLLQKESMAGQVQAIYFDPPYGIKYGSNFQPFVNKRDVKDRKDEDLTQEPEMIKAFRDTWELGIHSYLTYLRDRLLLAKELLSESGSVFVQISDENLHHTKEILDEVFGAVNAVSVITVRKTGAVSSPDARVNSLATIGDFIVWYAKDKSKLKYRQLFVDKSDSGAAESQYRLRDEVGLYQSVSIESNGYADTFHFPIALGGKDFRPASTRHWSTTEAGIYRVAKAGRVLITPGKLRFKKYLEDFPVAPIANIWTDMMGATGLIYVVQTNERIIERCLLMTTDPGDLVLDPTCGSGTMAYVAEKWGRRWITCDTSRVAVTLAKQRLMTASYDYYELRYPHEGLRGGFIWKTVPHVTLKSIANNPDIDAIYERLHPAIEQALKELNKALKADAKEWEVPFDFPGGDDKVRAAFEAFHAARQAMQKAMDRSIADHADQETLYDQPAKSKTKLRITGPFSVEAVPFPTVQALDDESRRWQDGTIEADATIARSGESARQHQWRDELLKTGIRGKGGQMLKFAELETLPGTKYLHCTGHTEDGQRVVVHFGPEHAALEQRAVANALAEAGELFPLPKMIVFCAFAFDPEAAKDIDHLKGIVALKAQMNTDLLTEDLKKARSSNQSFWLMGQPDVAVRKRKDGLYEVEVNGFDYFDTAKGELVSGGKGRIAMWSLDTDYDERSLFPHQVFFPLAGKGEGWEKLKKDIRAELDEDALDSFHGTVSLPFEAGPNNKVAVKIVDDRGIESLRILGLD
ncbi:MAG: site-specific DNA-methyltransferase [Pseudomonadota bacterium]|jgi:adenine-specific DNA-methyltransferase